MPHDSRTFVRNPLVVSLGRLLSLARRKRGISSQEAAAEIGLSGSLYRLLEAGSSPLHPGRVLAVIQVFPDERFSLGQLAILTVATQAVQLVLNDANIARSVMDDLACAHSSLGEFATAIDAIWDAASPSDFNSWREVVQEPKVIDALSTFLRDEIRPKQESIPAEFPLEALLDFPPSYYPVLESLAQTVRALPSRLTLREFTAWREKQTAQTKTLFILILEEAFWPEDLGALLLDALAGAAPQLSIGLLASDARLMMRKESLSIMKSLLSKRGIESVVKFYTCTPDEIQGSMRAFKNIFSEYTPKILLLFELGASLSTRKMAFAMESMEFPLLGVCSMNQIHSASLLVSSLISEGSSIEL